MSLILEALRKSEAERRRGLPPDLRSELPPPPSPGHRGLPAWGWATLAVAVAVLATWSWSRQPSGTGNVETPRGVGTAAETDRPIPASASDDSATSPVTRLPARTPAQPVSPPTGEAAATAAPATEAPPAGVPLAEAPSPAVAAPPGAAQPPRQKEPVPPPSAGAPAATEPRETVDAARPAPSGDGRVLDVAELDPGTRQALPPLKLSMHLWNEDPARRFVILDGRRLGEGDRIGEASIVRIERDGVLLQWQGRGIRIPVH